MNHVYAKKITTILLACSLAAFPVGCGGQNEPSEVDLRVNETPLDRESHSAVDSYAGILSLVQPAVVSVYSERMVSESGLGDHPAFRRFFGEEELPEERVQSGVGSGVIISPQGYVITNNHVIEDAERIIVQLADNREVEAEVVGTDPATDIAVLRISAGSDLPSAVLADSDQAEVGDVVFALGNALGIGHAVTSGIISARGRTGIGILGEEGYEDFIQTDASMNVGNSGGPLVDSRGRVVGINTAIASPGGGNVGIGFAIPINMARDVMQSLIETGEVRRGYLGLTLRDPERSVVEEYGAPGRNGATGEDEGVMVVNVVEGSPAEEAGLQEGDVVVALNGESVDSASDLRLKVGQLPPDANVELELIREGERLQIPAVLGSREEANRSPASGIDGNELLPGLMVAPLTPEIRETLEIGEEVTGLLVTEVAQDSPHVDVFPVGSIILQINREPVEDIQSAHEAIDEGRNLFLVLHEGSFHYLMIEIAR